jgi:hypothetical protein
MNGMMVMNADFLLKNRDEHVLDNYLKLLAFTAQETNSSHELMTLKLENAELKRNVKKLQDENSGLANHCIDDLFTSEDASVQANLNARIQQYFMNKTATGAKSLYKSGVGALSSMFKEKTK